jgi:D-xylose transport system substrate-binding protein
MAKKKWTLAVLAIAALALAGCSATAGGGGSQGSGKVTIAWLSPNATTSTRWETQDLPAFKAEVKKLDPSAVVTVSVAGNQADQLKQGEAALTKGANALVINPLTADGAAPLVLDASRSKVPVIAYDGLLTGSKIQAYVSYDNEKVGELQAQYLVDHLAKGATIAMINGEQTCDACIAFKTGAHKVLDPLFKSGALKLGYEADTPGWLTTNAQNETDQALTKLDNNVDGILAANDGLAQGVIAALTAQHLNGKVLVTGQDATLTGVQDIVTGSQTMTVYKNIPQEAKAAAIAAVALAEGKSNTGLTTKVKNGSYEVPSLLLNPVAVDQKNLADTIIKDKFLTKAQICTGAVAAKCTF